MSTVWHVDAIEEGIATLIHGAAVEHVDVRLLPSGVRAGDALRVVDSAWGSAVVATDEAEAVRREVRSRLEHLSAGDYGNERIG